MPLRVLPVQIAHSHIAVKFSQSENSSLLFLYFKKAMEFFNFLQLLYCKNIVANTFEFVKPFFKVLLKNGLTCQFLTTLLLKHIFKLLSSFFLTFIQRLAFCLGNQLNIKSCLYFLVYSSKSWPLWTEGIRPNNYYYFYRWCKTNLNGWAQSTGCLL